MGDRKNRKEIEWERERMGERTNRKERMGERKNRRYLFF